MVSNNVIIPLPHSHHIIHIFGLGEIYILIINNRAAKNKC